MIAIKFVQQHSKSSTVFSDSVCEEDDLDRSWNKVLGSLE